MPACFTGPVAKQAWTPGWRPHFRNVDPKMQYVFMAKDGPENIIYKGKIEKTNSTMRSSRVDGRSF